MMPTEPWSGPQGNPTADFCTTHWSVVRAAGREDSTAGARALEQLCRAYWYPLYAFVRRRGHGAEEARDLTQEFFARLLDKNSVAVADPSKGRFRTFLLTAVSRFLINEWERARAQKRGGDVATFSLDDGDPEERYRLEPADNQTPEKLFEQRWAQAVLAQVLAQLRREFERVGQAERFEQLKPCLLEDPDAPSQSELAARLGLTVAAVNSAIHRLRQRYAALLRMEIAHTVASPAEVEEEIRHLLAALSG